MLSSRALVLDKRCGRTNFLTDEVMTKIERLPAVAEKDLEALHRGGFRNLKPGEN